MKFHKISPTSQVLATGEQQHTGTNPQSRAIDLLLTAALGAEQHGWGVYPLQTTPDHRAANDASYGVTTFPNPEPAANDEWSQTEQ